jgi:chemotaxis methyl-accepting protein methylase
MRVRRMRSLQEYYHYVAFNPAGTAEWQELLDSLLNHETSFFRHSPSFTTLTGYVLPALFQARDKHGAQTLHMWSAGCSMGQEVYSLAMGCVDFLSPPTGRYPQEPTGLAAQWQIRVMGSDISRRALSKARQGQYKAYEIRSLPEHYRTRYFTTLGTGHNLVYHVVPQIQALVEFTHINLQDSITYPAPCFDNTGVGMDIIFCQNVLIYFATASRVEIVRRLCQRLRPGACYPCAFQMPYSTNVRCDFTHSRYFSP